MQFHATNYISRWVGEILTNSARPNLKLLVVCAACQEGLLATLRKFVMNLDTIATNNYHGVSSVSYYYY